MPTLGQINNLTVIEKVADGLYLDAGELEEIFLPSWDVQANVKGDVKSEIKEGDTLDVFLYLDARDIIMATLAKPKAVVGECALLKVLSVGKFGAFLDWGLGKDLLLPHSEQAYPVEEGNSYVVYVFKDTRSNRIAATTKFHFHLEESSGPYKKGEQVELLIAAKSELGYKAVINGSYLGLIHHAELNQPLVFGDRMKGWIRDVRDDGKVDLTINTLDDDTRDDLAQAILDQLKQNEGSLPFSDKSSPEEIFKTFKVSKKNFKRAISGLYKKRLISIEPTSITLAEEGAPNKKIVRPEKTAEEVAKLKGDDAKKNKNKQAKAPTRKTLSLSKAGCTAAPTKSRKETSKTIYPEKEKKAGLEKEHVNAHIYKKRT